MKKYNKLLIVIISLFFIVGCVNLKKTPTKKVETFLSKYQTHDKEVLDQLDGVINEAGLLDQEQKDQYRKIILNQYQNFSYKIKDEIIDGNNAKVVTEITVYNYGKAISEAEAYLSSNRSEFITDLDTDNINYKKFLDYKIKKMADTKDKITYTINFTLTKTDKEWKLDTISDVDRQKIHGLYY